MERILKKGLFPALCRPKLKGMERVNLRQIGKKAAENAEKVVIEKTLNETHWNRKEAAKLLKVSYKALLYKIQKYRLDEIKNHCLN